MSPHQMPVLHQVDQPVLAIAQRIELEAEQEAGSVA
jgi:hypothetical protein